MYHKTLCCKRTVQGKERRLKSATTIKNIVASFSSRSDRRALKCANSKKPNMLKYAYTNLQKNQYKPTINNAMVKNKIELPQGTKLPNHIAIIPDGNRRWARARDLPTLEGHRKGFNLAPKIFQTIRDLGIHTTTVWAFSTENWNRSKHEINYLMELYEKFIDDNLKDAKKDDVRIYHLGRKDRIPDALRKKIENAVEETKNNQSFVLNVGLDYGGHDEIIRTVEKIVTAVQTRKIEKEDFKKEVGKYAGKYPYYELKNYLDVNNQPHPYPDLMIRTSGEQRLSGFLSWECAYSEIYWERDHFPSFSPEKLKKAILDFSRRRRRFGGADQSVPNVQFKPEKTAELEINWWKAHNQNSKKELRKFSTQWIKELYNVGNDEAKEMTQTMFKAVTEGHNQRNWELAVNAMESFYSTALENMEADFDPRQVAELEVNWWQVHDDLEDSVDKLELEKAFSALYGELYQQSELQLREAVHWKAMATFEHDLAEKEGISKEKQEKHWQEAEKHLQNFYHELRKLVS